MPDRQSSAQYGIDRDTLAMKMTAARGIPAEVEISISCTSTTSATPFPLFESHSSVRSTH